MKKQRITVAPDGTACLYAAAAAAEYAACRPGAADPQEDAFQAINAFLGAHFMGFFDACCAEEGLFCIADDPQLELTGMDETGITLQAAFAVVPRGAVLTQPEGLPGALRCEPVTPEQILVLQQRVQKQHAVLEPLPREARRGDAVQLYYDCTVDGRTPQSFVPHTTRIDLGAGQTLEALEAQLYGRRAGDHFAAALTLPDDYADRTLAGRPARFSCRVENVCREVLPPLDNALARAAGHDDFAAWTQALRGELEARHLARAHAERRELLTLELGDRVQTAVPPQLAAQEAAAAMSAFQTELREKGCGLPADDSTPAQLREQQSARYARGVIGLYLLAARESLSPAPAELAETAHRHAAIRKMSDAEYAEGVGLHAVRQSLTRRLAAAWLETHAAAE